AAGGLGAAAAGWSALSRLQAGWPLPDRRAFAFRCATPRTWGVGRCPRLRGSVTGVATLYVLQEHVGWASDSAMFPSARGIGYACIMCGRYNLTASREQLAELFRLPEVPELPLRSKAGPTQPMPVVRATAGAGRELVLARWGLIPLGARPGLRTLAADLAAAAGAGPVHLPPPDIPPRQHVLALRAVPPRPPETPGADDGDRRDPAHDAHEDAPSHRWCSFRKTAINYTLAASSPSVRPTKTWPHRSLQRRQRRGGAARVSILPVSWTFTYF